MCFNRKVLVGLAVVAVGVLALAPSLGSRVVPLLAVAACPLSMVLMMRGMSKNGASCAPGRGDAEATSATTDQDAQMARLQAELDQLRAERAARIAGRDRRP